MEATPRVMRASGLGNTVGLDPLERSRRRPVLLATFDVPFAAEAAELAVDTAVESGLPLLVVNIAEIPVLPISIAMGYEYIGTEEVEASLSRPAELACALAVEVERLRICTPRPIDATIELVRDREPDLLVLGSDPSRLRRRFRGKVERKVREQTTCLVWSSLSP